jgi:D-glycero-D-manno-heptose 1,7-bisphosphate phosphatase
VRREPVLLLLDRDGTLIHDVGYPKDPGDVRFLPSAIPAVRQLVEWEFRAAIVSNQSGVGRGWITPEQAKAVHVEFVRQLGLPVVCFYCFHDPTAGCDCRKPAVGLLKQAAQSLGLPSQPSVMIGDKPSDVEAGRAFGATTILFGKPPNSAGADFVSDSWPAIVSWLEIRRL